MLNSILEYPISGYLMVRRLWLETNYFQYGIKKLFVFHLRAIAVIMCLSSINAQAGRLDDIQDQLDEMEFQQEMREIRRLIEERNRQTYSQQQSPQVNKFNPRDVWLKGYTQTFNNGTYILYVDDEALRVPQDFDSYTKEKPKRLDYFIEFLQPQPNENKTKYFTYVNGRADIYCKTNKVRHYGDQVFFDGAFKGLGINRGDYFKYENIKGLIYEIFLPYVCR